MMVVATMGMSRCEFEYVCEYGCEYEYLVAMVEVCCCRCICETDVWSLDLCTFGRASIPVVCLPERIAILVRQALRVPSDVEPGVLLPLLLLARLEGLGYPKHLCKQALDRVGNNLTAASGW